jgi:hypothetical protein
MKFRTKGKAKPFKPQWKNPKRVEENFPTGGDGSAGSGFSPDLTNLTNPQIRTII